MNILVTGGAGFIGSELSKFLIKNGHKVIILDNLEYYKNVCEYRNIVDVTCLGGVIIMSAVWGQVYNFPHHLAQPNGITPLITLTSTMLR